jgi:hypothetical protein
MKRFALLACGIGLIALGSGCCCSHLGGGACSPCGPAGCGVTQGYPYGTAYNSYGAQSAALPNGVVIASTPAPGYQTAAVKPLSTY